jgi:uncharacterized protein YajQ (UPF0234 family)
MASISSFDVTTGVDFVEVRNAVEQANREIAQRYDFKGLKVSLALHEKEKTLTLGAPNEFKLRAMWELLQEKLVRRKVPLKNLRPGKVEPAAGASVRQEVAIVAGLDADQARELVRVLKDAKLRRVQSAIQGDTVRVSAPVKDDLQAAIALLKEHDFGVELRFGNYRTN